MDFLEQNTKFLNLDRRMEVKKGGGILLVGIKDGSQLVSALTAGMFVKKIPIQVRIRTDRGKIAQSCLFHRSLST